MTTSKINKPVYQTVTLGAGGYGNDLLITASGSVAPTAAGANAIVASSSLGTATVLNKGSVLGGTGAAQSGSMTIAGSGGDALYLQARAAVHNQGTITGGAGGASTSANGYGGTGGVGVFLGDAGRVSNSGTIAGGMGGAMTAQGGVGLAGNGGTGVELATGGTLDNHGLIVGGAGGTLSVSGLTQGSGGVGVLLEASAVVTNQGTIQGGMGGYFYAGGGAVGGVGVRLDAGGVLTNAGLIVGGTGGNADYYAGSGGVGALLTAGGRVSNGGTILGGNGGVATIGGHYSFSGSGGNGVEFDKGGTLVNRGLIQAAAGGYNSSGGRAVDFKNGGTLTNYGTLVGGEHPRLALPQFGEAQGVYIASGHGIVTNLGTVIGGGYGFYGSNATLNYGATGIDLHNSGTLMNSGLIEGGAGGYSSYSYTGFSGGIGLNLAGSVKATNTGTIAGGAAYPVKYNPGGGGVGLHMSAGNSLLNRGLIEGGNGGSSLNYGSGGRGGEGVYLAGGMLTNAGTIAGGLGGAGTSGNGTQGDAVQFGGKAGATLVVDPGAMFSGDIVASTAVNDTLDLASGGAGTLSGFGSTIAGFTTITEANGAHWLLVGKVSGSGTLAVGSHAALQIGGALTFATTEFAAGGAGSLILAKPSQVTSTFAGFGKGDTITLDGISATSLTYHDGTLTLFNAAHMEVDKLLFAGTYTPTDFGLKAVGGSTELTFTGTTAANTYMHFLQPEAETLLLRFGFAHGPPR